MKTLELPLAKYRITKLSSINNNISFLDKGATFSGVLSPSIFTGKSFIFDTGTFSDSMNTSVVTDFKLLPKNKIEIHTRNSIYLLEEID